MGSLLTTSTDSHNPNAQSMTIKVTSSKRKDRLDQGRKNVIPSKTLKVENSGSILLNNEKVDFAPEYEHNEANATEVEELMKVNWEEKCIEIMPHNSILEENMNTLEKCWYLLDPKDQGHVLQAGDIIKFGKVKLRVKSLNSAPSNEARIASPDRTEASRSSQDLTSDSLNSLSDHDEEDESKEEKAICRICLEDTSDEDNPIVHPCRCSGSIRNVHISCLRRWYVDNIVTMNSTYLSCYYWERLRCELCKNHMPNEVFVNKRSYSLIEVPVIKEPHISFECFMNDNSNGFFIIKFTQSKNELTVGSAEKSDIRINDPSVCRDHATLKFDGKSFRVHSTSSKMTTSVSIQNQKIPFSMLKDLKLKLKGIVLDINAPNHVRNF